MPQLDHTKEMASAKPPPRSQILADICCTLYFSNENPGEGGFPKRCDKNKLSLIVASISVCGRYEIHNMLSD